MQPSGSMRVLVTGGTGFIGGHLARRLVEQQREVICVVRESSNVDSLRRLNAALVKGNLLDAVEMARIVSEVQPDVVFHVAGQVRALSQPEFTRTNADAVRILASACAQCKRPPVLVHVSSVAAAGPCTGDRARDERDAPAPVSAYGRSKLAGEAAAIEFAERVPLTIVRPPVVFGPGDHGVLQMMKPIARFGVHPVPGDGMFRLSVVYVDDLVEAMIAAAVRGERAAPDVAGSGVYFLAFDTAPTYCEFGRLFANALGRPRVRMLHTPPTALRIAARFADLYSRLHSSPTWFSSDKVSEALAGSWECSPAKAREQLGWAPAKSLSERLAETARWHRETGWL